MAGLGAGAGEAAGLRGRGGSWGGWGVAADEGASRESRIPTELDGGCRGLGAGRGAPRPGQRGEGQEAAAAVGEAGGGEACLRWDQGARGEASGAPPSIAELKAAASTLHPTGSRGLEGGEQPPHHPVRSRGGRVWDSPHQKLWEGSVARDLSPV